MLAEHQLDAVGAQGLAQRLAEGRRLARENVVGTLHERHLGAHAAHGLRHLHAHRPAAEHKHAARHFLETGDLAVGPHAVQVAQAVDRRYHRVGARREHDVVGRVLAVADRDGLRVRQAGRAAEHVYALGLGPLGLARVVVAGGLEVAPAERPLGVHDAAVHHLRRARRLARLGQRLPGAKQRLRRDAGPVRALPAEQLALGDGDLQAAAREGAGAVLSRRSAADDDDVVIAQRSLLSLDEWVGSLSARRLRYNRSSESRSMSRPSRHVPSGARQWRRSVPTGRKPTAS